MDEHNENQQQQQSRKRKKRGPTVLTNDQKYNPKNEIEFDNLGQSVGNKQARFSSWIGVQARTRLSINKNDWHEIKEEDKEQLWLRVKERSRRNRKNALKNKNPARVGPRGYCGRKITWEKEKQNKEMMLLLDGIQDTRARDWVHARMATNENGSKVLPGKIKPIVDQIIECDRKKSQGSWVPSPGVDSLIQVLGPGAPWSNKGSRIPCWFEKGAARNWEEKAG